MKFELEEYLQKKICIQPITELIEKFKEKLNERDTLIQEIVVFVLHNIREKRLGFLGMRR